MAQLDERRVVWADLNVNANDWFSEVPRGVEAVVTQIDAQLVFTLGMETPVAFVAGGVVGPFDLGAGVNGGMDFKCNHSSSPKT